MDTVPHADITRMLAAAKAAISSADQVQASALLRQIVELDEECVEAWWLLSQISDSREDREICLENVVTLDPQHLEAQVAWHTLMGARPLYVEDLEAALSDPLKRPATLEPWALLDDEFQCVYCAAAAGESDLRCPNCGRSLWERFRVVEELSFAYWAVLASEFFSVLGCAILLFVFFAYLVLHLRIDDFTLLLPFYFEPASLPAVLRAEILSLASPLLFWLPWLGAGISLAFFLTFLTRWAKLYFVWVGFGVARAMVGVAGLVFSAFTLQVYAPLEDVPLFNQGISEIFVNLMRSSVVFGYGLLFLGALASLYFLFSLSSYFTFREQRLLLRLDSDVVKSELGLLLRGRTYARDGRWAAAALHLRYSLVLRKRLEAYLLLVLAYVKLGFLDKAELTLQDARQIAPDEPRLTQFAELIAAQTGNAAVVEKI